MMSYFGHAHIHLAGEEKLFIYHLGPFHMFSSEVQHDVIKLKYVARNIAKPEELLHRGRISTFITANPS